MPRSSSQILRYASYLQLSFRCLACAAAVSFPFPGGEIEKASEQSAPGVSNKMGRSGEGVSEKGEGVGRKEIARLNPSPCSLFSHWLAVSFPSRAFFGNGCCAGYSVFGNVVKHGLSCLIYYFNGIKSKV